MSRPAPGLWRALVGLAAVVLVLALANAALDQRRAARRTLTASLRPLVDPRRDVVPERVRSLRVTAPGSATAWEYRREGGLWRHPALFDAYAAADRVELLLAGLLATAGTVVSTDSDDFARYGVTPAQAVRVAFGDGRGAPLVEFLLGRPAPDDRGGEAYVRLADSDTVFHLHANPRLALAGGTPPLLDPHLLPRALARRPWVELRFEGSAAGDRQRLRRVDLPRDPAAGPPAGGPAHAWLLVRPGRQDTCAAASAGAYLSYLQRLRFARLVDPAGAGYALGSQGQLALIDEAGAEDRLELGGPAGSGQTYLGHPVAGLVGVIADGQARLLFPTAAQLLLPLPQPTPYDAAEPPGAAP